MASLFLTRFGWLACVALLTSRLPLAVVVADGPADNRVDQVRSVPPNGIDIPDTQLATLQDRCDRLRQDWTQQLGNANADRHASMVNLRSEVLVFPRAVELTIEFGQFYKPSDLDAAARLLDEADRRMKVIQRGGTWRDVVGWTTSSQHQWIAGGFVSNLDDSIQPYGLWVPPGLDPNSGQPTRLDVWFHGRGETVSEVSFLRKFSRPDGDSKFGNDPSPPSAVVLHPYGRYCNAFKFAGEIDVLESMRYVASRFAIDANRIAVRGFSMGGAGCWQFATHYPDRFFAATPGAGFCETPEFLRAFQGEDARKTAADFQQTLWQWYDCPPWCENLRHCPTVAYSGEIDRQKQAADVMESALKRRGIALTHLIGPDTAHKVHPDARIEIERRLSSIEACRTTVPPRSVNFTTLMLRYHKMHWVDVQGLIEHWQPATIAASITDDHRIEVQTHNIDRFALRFDAGQWRGNTAGPVKLDVDGDRITGPLVGSDRSWSAELALVEGQWSLATAEPPGLHRKRPGLQGPIDDAFMDRFIFVLPSVKSSDPAVDDWIQSESQHAMREWRRHFRGNLRVVNDVNVTEEMIQTNNLIVFGDPRSNAILVKTMAEMPLHWTDEQIAIGDHRVDSAGHVPVMIYPNPMQPDRYLVLNSGVTFREYDYLNNARQTPKLPDWAFIDVRDGATSVAPGKIESAGFFDERWQPKPSITVPR